MSGRAATAQVIPGDFALSVGMPDLPAPPGWTWRPLLELARLESGHTPSRRRPEWWGGDVPWIGIKDAREHHGMLIRSTLENTNAQGLKNSAARLLPAGTVCLSRTASVGYATVTEAPMATSQDFVNWVCGDEIVPEWLMKLFIAEASALHRFSKGSTHRTIYFPEVKAFHVCLPPVETQHRIVARLDAIHERTRAARAALEAIPPLVETFRQSVLAAAFRGDLTADWRAQHPDVEPASVLLERTEPPSRPNRWKSRSREFRPGDTALCVGRPKNWGVPATWSWAPLLDIARMESGHTPSRRHPEWWGGDIPWVGITDAREHHGGVVRETLANTNAQGIKNSAARVLPAGTVCLSRTASVGYVTRLGADMATSQDFANFVCTTAISAEWLQLLFMAEAGALRRFAKGSTHQTIYYPELLSFHVALPPRPEQDEIVKRVRERLQRSATALAGVGAQLDAIDCAERAALAKAFRGELVP